MFSTVFCLQLFLYSYNVLGDIVQNSISIDEFLKLSNINIIDIRSIQAFNNNHIPGSINIPYQKLLVEPSKYLSFGKIYYLYCQKGYSSYKISNILNSFGYKTISINGGYEEWILKR